MVPACLFRVLKTWIKLPPSLGAFTPLIDPVWSPKALGVLLSLWLPQALSLFSLFHKGVVQAKSQSVDSDLCLACFSALDAESGPQPMLRTLVPAAIHTCADMRVLVCNTGVHEPDISLPLKCSSVPYLGVYHGGRTCVYTQLSYSI